jgi:hypothetical protein
MRHFFSFLLVFSIYEKSLAVAAKDQDPPVDWMTELDQFLGEPNFEKTFQVGTRVQLERKECLGKALGKCDIQKVLVRVEKVENVNEDVVASLLYHAGGTSKPTIQSD